jgi:hypothetical protein
MSILIVGVLVATAGLALLVAALRQQPAWSRPSHGAARWH